MDDKVKTLINEQIQKEMFSAYLYLEMSNYYENEGLNGFANWFFIQAKEEMDHAMLFRTYVLNNDETVTLLPIDAPGQHYKTLLEPLNKSLEHEKFVTDSIHKIYAAALDAKDFRAIEFLNWFVKEQGEEEKNALELIQKYKLFGTDGKGLHALNQELAGRVYSAPSYVLD
jgi:ferritin